MILAAIMIAFTESRTIIGKVTNSQDNPIPGVSVHIKGTTAKTITDLNGSYKITADEQAKVLVFSCIGYASVEVKIGERRIINVRMQAEAVPLEEAVIAGYGTKRDMATKSMITAAPGGLAYQSRYRIPHFDNNYNNEGYASVNENGYKNVRSNPLSTFSIDVDNLSKELLIPLRMSGKDNVISLLMAYITTIWRRMEWILNWCQNSGHLKTRPHWYRRVSVRGIVSH